MNRGSVMFAIQGIENVNPRMVAREELIDIFAGMANGDLIMAHTDLYQLLPKHIDSEDHWVTAPAKELMGLLEAHMRATNALHALLAMREPDELVEAHLP